MQELQKLCNKANKPFPVKSPFTCSLLWVTNFQCNLLVHNFQLIKMEFRLGNSINLDGDVCLFLSLYRISHNVLWGKEG